MSGAHGLFNFHMILRLKLNMKELKRIPRRLLLH